MVFLNKHPETVYTGIKVDWYYSPQVHSLSHTIIESCTRLSFFVGKGGKKLVDVGKKLFVIQIHHINFKIHSNHKPGHQKELNVK